MRQILVGIVFVLIATAVVGQTPETPALFRIAPTSTLGWAVTDQYSQLYGSRFGYGFQMSGVSARRPGIAGLLSAEYRSALLNTIDPVQLEVVRPEIGVQLRRPIGDRVAFFVHGLVGYGGVRVTPEPIDFALTQASGLTYRAGVGAEVVLGSLYTFADVSWDSFRGIYDGISARVGVGLQFGGRGARGTSERTRALPVAPQPLSSGPVGFVDLEFEFSMNPVFPVLYKYYDNEPIGWLVLTNTGDAIARAVEVRLNMTSYVDNPKLSATIETLAPGEEVTVPLYALFNEGVRSITEGDKIAAVVEADYRIGSESGQERETVTVEFYDRNAIQWDDDNKVAAFVTARDEGIRPLASNLAAIVRQNRRDAVSSNFQLGLMMYLGMVQQGLAYSFDPTSSYEVRSQDALVVDSVQFPRQTLAYRGGDCDDLSVAYAALLESVAVPTAFVTIPGHIYLAFGLDMTAEEAQRTFGRPEDLIFRDDGSVWVPIETTLLEDGFSAAWDTGARQWREHDPQGLAGFFPTSEAWNTYQPVSYTGQEEIRPINDMQIEESFNREIATFVKREIADRELNLKARLEQAPNNARLRNRLGVLYASYGLTAEARTEFTAAVAIEPYAPALANLGSIAFLEGDLLDAESLFEQAIAAEPGNAAALLGLARTNHQLENFGLAQRHYDRLKEESPTLALQYAYLELRGEEASRASDAASLGGRVYWATEDEE